MSGIIAITFEDMASHEVAAVKNGFIHFHRDICECPKVMTRSNSLPALGDLLSTDDSSSDDEGFNSALTPTLMKAFDAKKGQSPIPFELRTPSTTCSSPIAPARPSPQFEVPRTPRAHTSSTAVASTAAPRGFGTPFASLLLPTWAMEKAANAPRPTEFGDLESWYSESPRSTPASSPAASPMSSPRLPHTGCASWVDSEDEEEGSTACGSDIHADDSSVSAPVAPVPSAVRGSSTMRVHWADLAEEESDSEAEMEVVEPMGSQGVQWADLAEQEELEDALVSATVSKEVRRVVLWADLAEELCDETNF